MGGAIDIITDRTVLIVVSNPGTSGQTGWTIGFWWAELTHPYWEFTEHGYHVVVPSPDGSALTADPWSDPRYSAEDLISLGFVELCRSRSACRGVQGAGRGVGRRLRRGFLIGGQGGDRLG